MKQKQTPHPLWKRTCTKKILASLLSILIGLVVGSAHHRRRRLLESGARRVERRGTASASCSPACSAPAATASGVLTWGFNSTNFGNMLFRATPLIMTGLSVAVAFKTGLFNIGAPGQYLMGTARVAVHRARHPHSSSGPPRWLIWILAFLGGVAGRCALGRDPRRAQGVFEHQRGAGEHHDQLAGGKPRDVDVRHQQLQKPGREHQVRLHLQDDL